LNVIKIIKNLFRREEVIVESDLKFIKKDLPVDIDYDTFDDVEMMSNDKDKFNMLLMDDFLEQFTLYDLDFKKIKREYFYDVKDKINIIKAAGKYAGFMTYKLLKSNKIRIDFALLDLTLETSIKISNGDIIEYDGIDIAFELLDRNKDCIILFCTAHSLNKKDPLMSFYIKKFEERTNLNFDDFYMSKASIRHKRIYEKILEMEKSNAINIQ